MLMLWVTKVFHTGPARVGRLSKHIVLPRTVPLPVVMATPAGFAVGLAGGFLLIGLLGLEGSAATRTGMLSAIGGAGAAALLVTAQPWRGEHVHRVAAVRAMALASQRTLICPGSAMPTLRSDETGTLVCCECGRVFGASAEFAPEHQWRRRVYLGMKPIPHPITGDVQIVSGSLPVAVKHDPTTRSLPARR